MTEGHFIIAIEYLRASLVFPLCLEQVLVLRRLRKLAQEGAEFNMEESVDI